MSNTTGVIENVLRTTDICFREERFSGQVLCVARNYKTHCKELNNAVPRAPNFFFKSASSVVLPPGPVLLPDPSYGSVQYEAEIALIVGTKLENLPRDKAIRCIAGVTGAVDITGRSVQSYAKRNGLSWTLAKGLRSFCPLCPHYLPVSTQNDDWTRNTGIKLHKNGALVQQGSIKDFIFEVGRLLSYLSSLITLYPGDIVLTGTPNGVGDLVPGDCLRLEVSNGSSSTEAEFVINQRPDLPPEVEQFEFMPSDTH